MVSMRSGCVLAGFVLAAAVAISGAPPQKRPLPARSPAAGVAFPRTAYLQYARASADWTWEHRAEIVANWRATFDPAGPFGYRGPGGLPDVASIYARLFEWERNPVYAERAREILLTYGDYRSQFPEAAARQRPDYANGVPALADFFLVMRFVRAYEALHRLGQFSAAETARMEAVIAQSIDYLLQTSEWGTMNRTMLRAESLAWAVRAMPSHPRVAAWEQQRRALGDDNWGNWEIEDTSLYHGVWLYAMLGYADATGRLDDLAREPEMYYYAHYFLNQMAPDGFVPPYGDSNWTSSWQHFLVFFEAAASRYRDPQMKWAAQRIAGRFLDLAHPTSSNLGCFLLDAYRWGSDDIPAVVPTTLTREVMEDVQGKKIVFRNGWSPDSTYLLLNYRDEGDGGVNFRDYLRDTLPVEEEKMTHGHADENSLSLLMSGGSTLLHDGGYRDYMPSGPFGAYRQDYFHNRLCVRPEKLWMGQKPGEGRYSATGAIPQQPLLEFMRNAGSYRPVRTRKVDFLTLPELDYSRTRVVDDGWGYDADRVVVYVKDPELFVVFDLFKARREEFFTLAGLWHTRQVYARGSHWYDTGYDAIATGPGAKPLPLSDARRLLVIFPQSHFRVEGVEPITRNFQDEQAVYQAVGRHFEPAQTEGLVTVLVPHAKADAPADLARRVSLVETAPEGAGLAVRIDTGDRVITVGVKQDLRRDIARDYRRPRYLFEKGRVAYGSLETDGDLVFTSERAGRLGYAIVNMTRAQRGSRVLFQNAVAWHGLTFDGSAETAGVDKVRYWRDTVAVDGAAK